MLCCHEMDVMDSMDDTTNDQQLSVCTYRVLYGDCDQMGIVYHPNYLKYLEMGRIEFLRSRGYSYAEMERSGIRIPVLKIGVEYKQSARFDDVVRVETILEHINRIRLGFRYEIWCEERKCLLAVGHSEHAFTNRENRPQRVEELFVQALRRRSAQ
jgi:acyl-CoA thioester hydrolase